MGYKVEIHSSIRNSVEKPEPYFFTGADAGANFYYFLLL